MFTPFDPLKSLEKHLGEFDFNSRKPFYNDSSDYTTNAPSYYDDLARKNKLIKHLALRIWDYDKELAERFAAWDKNLEEFDDEVLRLLQEWMDDGTFDHIINDTIFNNLNNKVNSVRDDLDLFKVDIINDFDSFKGDIRLELDNFRNDLDTGLTEVRNDLDTGFTEVRNDLDTGLTEVRNDLDTGLTEIKNDVNRISVFLSDFGAVGNANYFNVTNNKWYADSDITVHSTNDTQAFINAIEYLKSVGGGTLNLDSGKNFLIKKLDESSRFAVHLNDVNNIKITSPGRGVIRSEGLVDENHFTVLRFSYVNNLEISNINFEVYTHGIEPPQRTNGMIMSIDGGGDFTKINENILIKNNRFRIKHTSGETAKKSTYGVYLSGESLRATRKIKIEDNSFTDISGRNIEFVKCNDIIVTNNRITDLGTGYLAVGFRFIAGCANVIIHGNIIYTALDSESAQTDCIQVQHGADNIPCANFFIYNNIIYIQSDSGLMTGINLYALGFSKINNNFIRVTNQSDQSIRYTRGILLNQVEGMRNSEIEIFNNRFDGLTNYALRNSDPSARNITVKDNQFMDTFWGTYGRDIADPDRRMEVLENYFSARNRTAFGHDMKVTLYGESFPTAGDVSYFKNDIMYNSNPTPGSYVGWICTASGAPATWKGFGLIES